MSPRVLLAAQDTTTLPNSTSAVFLYTKIRERRCWKLSSECVTWLSGCWKNGIISNRRPWIYVYTLEFDRIQWCNIKCSLSPRPQNSVILQRGKSFETYVSKTKCWIVLTRWSSSSLQSLCYQQSVTWRCCHTDMTAKGECLPRIRECISRIGVKPQWRSHRYCRKHEVNKTRKTAATSNLLCQSGDTAVTLLLTM